MIQRRIPGFISIFLIFVCLGFPQSQNPLPVVRVGMVIDGYWQLNAPYLELFRSEILHLTRGEFDVRFPAEKQIESDWTTTGVKAGLDMLLGDPEVDLILAMGVIASQDVANRPSLAKPVIAPFILDAALMGFPLEEGASGVKNFNYVNIPERIIKDVRSFLRVVEFRKMAYLINHSYLDAVPELNTRGRDLLRTIEIDMQVIGVEESAKDAVSGLSPEIEAVFLGPLTHLPPQEFRRLVQELERRKLPSFSGFDVADVEQGVLASSVWNMFPLIARRVALNIQRILLGEEPGSIPVNIAIGERLTINMATARAIDIYPDWDVIIEAELIRPEREDIEQRLDLSSAVRIAVDVNLDLAARERFVAAGRQDVSVARSKLLPQMDLSGLGLIIDKDRAEASFGTQPQRSLSGSLSATQVIFSEPAWANLSIQKSLQITREMDLDTLRLDIALAASTAYLNVLRAKTFERIQRDNLRRTRANLEIARVREGVGIADSAEVYRWESEFASNQKAVIKANAQRNLAEIELNRLLHRPLEEPFITEEADLNDQVLYTSEKEFLIYTRNYRSFKLFRDFMVEEGLSASPELAALDAAIAARERAFRSASSSLWVPSLAFQGEVTNIFTKGGAGTGRGADLPPVFQLPEINDTNWSAALVLSFALVKGGEKWAVRSKAQKQLEELRLQKEALRERVEKRIRFALHLTGSSYVSIEKARLAAEAALKSLEVAQNAYESGTLSILYLLDTQGAAYNAEQAAADAVFLFLIDLMALERSVGNFEFFMSAEERQAFIDRLKDYYQRFDYQ